jgi:hypothetical protein
MKWAMTFRSVPRLSSIVVLAFFAIGCGVDCLSLCEDKKECEGADRDKDCAGECEQIESLVEKASCEDQYDDLLGCEGEQDDLCRADENACDSETKAYADCITEYCLEHLTDCADSSRT